ncbi:MAG: hypothetical protein WCI71_13205 [Bacteroidota bacterium]
MAWFPWVESALGTGGSLVYQAEYYKPSADGVVVYLTTFSGDVAVELIRVEAACKGHPTQNADYERDWLYGLILR